MSIISITILTILFVWLINRWRTREYVRLAFQVPSNRLHTWLGWGPIIKTKDAQTYLFNYAEKYGSESVFWSGPYSVFLTSEPEIIENILMAKNFNNKPVFMYKGLEYVIGSGLITISEPVWSRRRKLFNKAFSTTNLISFTTIFHEEIINTIHTIDKNLKLGKSMDMLLTFQALTVRTSFQTILKRDFECTDYNDNEIARMLKRMLSYAADICSNVILKVNIVRYLADLTIYRETKKTNKILHNLFHESINIYKHDSSYLADIVGPLDIGFTAEKQNLLSLQEMQDDIMHLHGAAFETSANTIFFVLCMLAMHHDCQERVYQEIITLLPDFSDYDKITFDQVNQLVYLDMILNETLRVLPPIPVIFRTLTHENFKLNNGHILPVGQSVCIDIFRLHRNKDIWGPEADRFNPENFSRTNVEQRHAYAFIPFSKGPRICIGYRYAALFVKIALVKLIQNFKFDTDFKYEDLKIKNGISLELIEEPKIKVERRELQSFQVKG